MMTEAAQTVVFYILAASVLGLSIAVVRVRRLLRAAVALMVMLTASAALYVLLGAEFLAGVQVLVYVGGIVVLIVFAIMLTRSSDLLEDVPSNLRRLMGVCVSSGFALIACGIVLTSHFPLSPSAVAPEDDSRAIGKALLDYGPNGYVLPFEIISLLLLAAAVGAIVIARRTPPSAQPFTSGGDLPPEAPHVISLSQRDKRQER
ncbi:MAG: NADH-quinone oxidoreductase subunit J [Candidatus Hydrogenedentes bacterium]|nr:NADH-quinone oxidoreductase subunit J [Candidatus Hydrogenedentota bacterium]